MSGVDIARKEWEEFLEQYSLNHEGWIVVLEWPGDDPDSANESEHTLEAIETNFENGEFGIVLFFAEREPIIIDDLSRISVMEEVGYEDETVEFQTPGTTLRMHLRFPQSEAQVDWRDELTSDADASGLELTPRRAAEEDLSIDEELVPQ